MNAVGYGITTVLVSLLTIGLLAAAVVMLFLIRADLKALRSQGRGSSPQYSSGSYDRASQGAGGWAQQGGPAHPGAPRPEGTGRESSGSGWSQAPGSSQQSYDARGQEPESGSIQRY